MDCKTEIEIFAKTGAIFAKCDGCIDDTEKDVITGIKENERFVSYSGNIYEECESIIEFYNAKDKEAINSYLFDELVSETNDYLDKLGYDEKNVFIEDLGKFIDRIIKADGKELYSENSLFNKWRKEICQHENIDVSKSMPEDVEEKEDFTNNNSNNIDNIENSKDDLSDSKELMNIEQTNNGTEENSDKAETKDLVESPVNKGISDKAKEKNLRNILFWIVIGVLALLIIIFIGKIINNNKNKEELEAFPLSSYTEKMLQFKEIDFSKVLIYGTESNDSAKDSLLLYFVKGTAVLRFRGLDNLNIDTTLSTDDTLFLNYNMENQTVLPIDIEIIYDESKCRLIDSFEAATLKDSPIGTGIKAITTVAGTAGGAFAGQAIGGLFGMKGKIIGAASGAVLGGVGSYIASSNFVAKTKLIKDNSSATIRDMLEDAKNVIAAQLLSDETVTQNTDKNEIDIKKISKYYRQQLTDILTNIICNNENCKWQNVEIRFDGAANQN